ncbi:hypothetical protein PG991_003853 [Apiospora marii]|uniref:Uncharacterized protein n=1 Tax=Apiospora marii TaxID=335849 RepID=A0ABR1S4N5_9PEZI
MPPTWDTSGWEDVHTASLHEGPHIPSGMESFAKGDGYAAQTGEVFDATDVLGQQWLFYEKGLMGGELRY